MIAAIASIVLAAGALVAARALACAANRYRLFAAGFVLVALVGPAALAAAAFRPAGRGVAFGAAWSFEPLAVPVLGLVAAFAAALLFELVLDVVRLRRIKRSATPLGVAGVRNARIGVSATVPTPTAIGYLHPAIVVPADFRERVDAAEWDAVVAHECAHLARRDDWAKAVQSALLRAGWWLPGLWILSRRLDLERELASDERAVASTGARRFAACLLRLATSGCHEDLAPGLWGRRSHVAIRVERLLRPVPGTSAVVRAAALGAFTATAIAVVWAAFAVVPSIGRQAQQAVRHIHHPVVIARAALRAPKAPGSAKVAYHGLPARAAEPAPIRVAAPVSPPRVERVPAAVPVREILAASPVARSHAAPAPIRTVVAIRPTPASALDALKGTVVAYLPRFRCATCFHPLHDPDGTVPAPAPPAGATPAPAIVAAEDTGSGPATGSTGFFTLRLPRALTLP